MGSVPMPRDLSEEAVAEWLHDDYEKSARVVGWKTQEACRVPWEKLPAANQAVMLLTARAVLALVEAERLKEREACRSQTEAKVREALDDLESCLRSSSGVSVENAVACAMTHVAALRAALAAPVSPPAAAKRERRTVWFMENSAGLWMRADFCENTQDPNEARWFSTRESCEAACDTVRRNGPHPGVRVYRPTEHIFFGDDEVPVSPPAPRGEAVEPVAWGVLNAYGKVVSTDADESDNNRMMERLREYGAEPPYHVVALVPQEPAS